MSEERVSALEKTLREKAGVDDEAYAEVDCMASEAYENAADLVHERDALLWSLVDMWEEAGNDPRGQGRGADPWDTAEMIAYADAAARLRAILEGKAE